MSTPPVLNALVRVFAVNPELVSEYAGHAIAAAHHLVKLSDSFPVPVIPRITLVVPTDQRYEDADCGLMIGTLQQMIAGSLAQKGVTVLESPLGDLSCAAMNHACFNAVQNGFQYSFTVSSSVMSWINRPILERMLQALQKGALIVPLAIEPHRRFVLNGRPLGTCTIWENQALFNVGGFNLMAARPRKKELGPQAGTRWIEDYWPSKRQVVSHVIGGMEEVYPTIQLIRQYKRPIVAPIDPRGIVQGDWVQPTDLERRLREEQKRATKFSRWIQLSTLMDAGPGFCLSGIMDGYRPAPEDIDFIVEY